MIKKYFTFVLIFFSILSFSSCQKISNDIGNVNKNKINSSIYYSTQFLDKFTLKEVNEDNIGKIPLKENVCYKIGENKENVIFYESNIQVEKKANHNIINDKIVVYNDSYICITYEKDYYLYDFTNDQQIDLELNLNDYDNMHLYVTNQKLYLIGSKNNKTDIFSVDENSREKIYSVDINTSEGVIFLYFWDEYYIIQNDKYEYKTNCDKNMSKLQIDSRLDVINNNIFGIVNFTDGEWDSTSYFFKHSLFYSEESKEKKYYESNIYEYSYNKEFEEYNRAIEQRLYCLNFYNNDSYIKYSGLIDECYKFYYNHVYYFLLTNWYLPYGEKRHRGYYFIRFDAFNSKFQISSLNMKDTVKGFRQIGNQIVLNLSLDCDGDFIDKDFYFYIK